jgi:hypothetical protein
VIGLYVHTWDLGTAAGVAVEIPADVIDFAHAYIDPLPGEMGARRQPGIRTADPGTDKATRPNGTSAGLAAGRRGDRRRRPS